MLVLVVLLALPAHAAATFGADWVPVGRVDLVAALGGGTSETGVAESDGLLVPPLTAWGGWMGRHDAVLGGVGIARFATRTATGDALEAAVVGALRPSVDYRRYLRAREPGRATPWVQAGGYGVIPSAAYTSDAWTDEEQAAWDEYAAEDRARIGAIGGRVGIGGEVLWDSGLSLGLRWVGVVERSTRSTADSASITIATRGEGAVVVGLTF